MKRRHFIRSSAALAAGVAVFPNLISCKQSAEKEVAREIFQPLSVNAGNLVTVRGNVSRFTNRGGTVGLLETKDGFVVIDAQFPDSIQPLLDSISEQSGKPIQYLCNTHHHGDHTAGNKAFEGKVDNMVAQKQVPLFQKARAEESDKLAEQVYASTLFDDEYKIELGTEKVHAYHYGGGHTFGDAIYYFEKDNVVHMGDLVFNDTIPVYRPKDGADGRNWIKILGTVIDQFSDDATFIFGHSHAPEFTTGTKDDVKAMQAFLQSMDEFIVKQMTDGKTLEETQAAHQFIPGHENRQTLWDGQFNTFIENLYYSYSTIVQS